MSPPLQEQAPDAEQDFAGLLRAYRDRDGRSRNALAKAIGVDPSYLTRIEHGDREPPRLHILDALARCLRLTEPEQNRLLTAAGYAPLSITRLGGWDETFQAVADVLLDNGLCDDERAEFRLIVRLMAARWRSPGHRLAPVYRP